MTPPHGFKPQLRAATRALRIPAAIGVLYLLLRTLFVWHSADQGLFTPDGSPDLSLVALGAVVLGLRLLGLFIILPLAIYRLMVALARPAGSAGDKAFSADAAPETRPRSP